MLLRGERGYSILIMLHALPIIMIIFIEHKVQRTQIINLLINYSKIKKGNKGKREPERYFGEGGGGGRALAQSLAPSCQESTLMNYYWLVLLL